MFVARFNGGRYWKRSPKINQLVKGFRGFLLAYRWAANSETSIMFFPDISTRFRMRLIWLSTWSASSLTEVGNQGPYRASWRRFRLNRNRSSNSAFWRLDILKTLTKRSVDMEAVNLRGQSKLNLWKWEWVSLTLRGTAPAPSSFWPHGYMQKAAGVFLGHHSTSSTS